MMNLNLVKTNTENTTYENMFGFVCTNLDSNLAKLPHYGKDMKDITRLRRLRL